MTKRFAYLGSRLALYLVMLLGLAACGGGGGGSGGGGGFTGGGSGGDVEVFISMELVDSSGFATNTVTSSEPATLQVRLTRKGPNGAPLPDYVVEATTDIGAINPASGSALTDADGRADFQIVADGDLGAGTITVSIQGNKVEDDDDFEVIESSLNFQVGQADLRLGYFDSGLFINGEIELSFPAIPAGGEVIMNMSVVDDL